MKEQVERKLGCTIEECCQRMREEHKKHPGECEFISPFSKLNADELGFVISYMENGMK